jgi:signal transduction histidine kinase/CheY-like chemotaxis protein
VIPLRSGADDGPRVALVVLARYRSLFHRSDLELLAALGAQTAVVAERRAIIAEQDALTAQLAQTVSALRAASQAKSDFLASMSHELRTPLAAILGFSELLRNEPRQGEAVVAPLEWVEHINRGGEHLLALINDVLDLSKVEAGRLDLRLEPVALQSAVNEVINGLRPLAERKQLHLTSTVPDLEVLADRGRFRQMLYNLFANAIKFTPSEGYIAVEADLRDDGVHVAVIDSGVGIALEDQGRVFEEFRQVGSDEQRQAGTGLGLALTRRLVEAHDGRIELESELGRGSRFTLVLPAARRTMEAPRVLAHDGPTVAAVGDVLVMEDDLSAQRLLREYLEPVGYTVRLAPDGERGLAMARESKPAAIILDVLLPRLDGWEVLRRLKDDPQLRDVPVIIVTVVDEREVGLALGAVDYLLKPIRREALLATLALHGGAPRSRDGAVRVLAVDDDPAALALLRHEVMRAGLEIVEATGGRQALERAQRGDIDLVICDIVMPDLDGFAVVAGLKADARTANLPILISTAHDLTEEQKARLHGQILGIVTKGEDARLGLTEWLARAAPLPGRGSPRDEVA